MGTTLEWFAKIATREGQANLNALADSAERVEKQLDRTRTSVDRMERGAGLAGASAGKMAGALGLVHPQAASAARTVADLADVLEVAAVGGKALGLSLGSVITIMAPVAIAVGAATLAWKHYSNQLKEAEERAKKAGEAAEAASKRAGGRDAFAAENTRLTNLASGALSSRDDKRNQLGAGLLPSFQPEMEAAKAAFAAALDAGDQAGMAAATRTLGALQDRLGGMVETRLQAEEALERNKKAEQGAAAAARDHTAALKDQAQAEAARIQNYLGGLASSKMQADFAGADFAGAQAAADAFAEAMQTALIGAMNEASFAAVRQDFATELAQEAQQDALNLTLRGGRGAARGGLGMLIGGDPAGMGQLLQAASGNLANRAAFLGQTAQGATGGMAAGLLGKGLGGLGAAMGPAGMLATIGSMGAKGVRGQLEGFKDAFIGGLEALPRILSEVLPDFVVALATELPVALIKAAPAIVAGVIKGVLSLLGITVGSAGDFSTPSATTATATQAIKNTSNPFSALGGGERSAQFLTPRMEFLNGGPAAVRASGRQGAQRPGATVVNHINTVTLDGLSGFNRENERMYGAGGLREAL